MIIGVDARTTQNQYKGRGIGNYTEHIIEWLPKADPNIRIETEDFSRVDVFLQPNFWDGFPIRQWRIKCPKVLMMHDLTPLVTNHFTERGALINVVKSVMYLLKVRNIKKADAILTNSEQTKKDVIKYAGVSPDIVHRVYLGVDEEFRTQNPVPREERGDYILFVGGVEANKNVLRLLRAFANIKFQISNSKSISNDKISNLKLIMPGGQFVNEDKIETKMIKAKVKELGLEDSVDFPGFVEQKDLVELYRKALVFVYPSYYEGFGFPVLEAMACGTPVVSSNASPLPEVGGPAVIYVDPFDVESIAEGILRVLGFNTLEYRSWVQKGLEQAAKFSWATCARETLEVLKSVTSNSLILSSMKEISHQKQKPTLYLVRQTSSDFNSLI